MGVFLLLLDVFVEKFAQNRCNHIATFQKKRKEKKRETPKKDKDFWETPTSNFDLSSGGAQLQRGMIS